LISTYHENFRFCIFSIISNYLVLYICVQDLNLKAFQDYATTMPFWAVPYTARSRRDALLHQLAVTQLPCLCFLDGHSGALLTRHGYEALLQPAFVQRFPFVDSDAEAPRRTRPQTAHPFASSQAAR
jgi:hypothetical protein